MVMKLDQLVNGAINVGFGAAAVAGHVHQQPACTAPLQLVDRLHQPALLQLAHATSTLANRGIVMTPHLVKRITDPSTNKAEDVPVEPAAVIPLKSRNVETVIAGMTDVSTKGTARFVFKDCWDEGVMNDEAKLVSVLSGKINTVYDLDEVLDV